MKPLLACCALGVICLSACTTASGDKRTDYDSQSRFAETPALPPQHTPQTPRKASVVFSPDPNEPITVDFLDRMPRLGFNPVPGLERMPFGGGMFGPWDPGAMAPIVRNRGGRILDLRGQDLDTALHHIAQGTGLQVIVEGDLDIKVSITFDVPDEGLSASAAKELIQSICKANKLDYIEDGNVVIVKRRPVELASKGVLPGKDEGRFDVDFESRDVVRAILETAGATRTQVFVPATLRSTGNGGEREGFGEIGPAPITLKATNATPDFILRELARLGGMEIEVIAIEDAVPGYGVGYKFSYPD